MTRTRKPPDSAGSRWWESPGSLRAALMRLDGQVGVVVNAEKQVTGQVSAFGVAA
jgi:hypothetical protein